MYTKLRKFWSSLDRTILVNKRELFLGAVSCTLAGILTGIFLSPKKMTAFGSFNGNSASDCGNGNSASCEDAEEAAKGA
ncbi:MAG: hypothetical protein Q4D50_07370 [Eubacteriales bacterium]|nr:hypothetical protein [Eubacteriales bacterium]